jgi:hypothetical protein
MSLPGRRSRSRLLALTFVLATAGLAAACGDGAPSGDAVRGLVILSGDVGETRLTIHASDDGTAREIDVPDRATAWVSGAPGGVVVATLADGRLAIRDVEGDPSDAWRFVSPADDAQPAGSLLFGAASPDGSRVAALTLGAAGQFGLAVADAGSGRSVVFPVEGDPVLTSPAWIDGDRVGVVVVDADLGGAVSFADVGSGDVTGGPGNVRALAVSGDGSAIAWISTVDSRLYGSDAASWLAGQEVLALAIEAPSADAIPGSFALDAPGERLAVVWEREDGRAMEIAVHRRTSDGWTVADRLDAPGGDPRAVVSWLR